MDREALQKIIVDAMEEDGPVLGAFSRATCVIEAMETAGYFILDREEHAEMLSNTRETIKEIDEATGLAAEIMQMLDDVIAEAGETG